MKYALANQYPIDTEEQVKIAFDFFDDNIKRFAASDRVEIANNLEKRANDLGIDSSDYSWVPNYGRMMKKSASYSPDFGFNINLRKEACLSSGISVMIDGVETSGADMIDKIASSRDNISPKAMVVSLAEFDKLANLDFQYDETVMDPVYTVFGSEMSPNYDQVKIASNLTDVEIKKAAKNTSIITKLKSIFGEGFAKEFKSSPESVFKSMPAPEKELILKAIKG